MPDSDELHGWKEIAAYLGKSVRAAQRWERELGLPVRRIRTSAGYAIYARRSEIHAWRVKQEMDIYPSSPEESQSAASAGFSDASLAGQAIPIATSSRDRGPWGGKRVLALAAFGAVILFAGLGWQSLQREPGGSPVYVLSGDRLVALDESGSEVWNYRFPHPLGDFVEDYTGGADPGVGKRVRHADIDGDGSEEVLAMIRLTSMPDPSDVLFCFTKAGQLLWTYQPKETLDFAGVAYSGPWMLTDWVTGDVEGKRSLFVAVNHRMWWPSMVVKIAPNGQAERFFTQSGGIYGLAWWTRGDRPYLLAGGINNEYGAATLAQIDPSAGPVSSPQTKHAGYRCSNCPNNGPAQYFVFPPTDVTVASGAPYGRVYAVSAEPSSLKVYIQEDLRDIDALRVFTLSPGLEFQDTTPVDYFWSRHDRLHRDQLIDHSSSHCPHRNLPTAVRTWTPGMGWRWVEVPSAAPKLVGNLEGDMS